MARIRNKNRRGLDSYQVDLHKVAIVYRSGSRENEVETVDNAIAFSERVSRLRYGFPNRFSEEIIGRRASENFFSEYDFFATGGSPLDLNQESVNLSILAENISVVGPVSVNARKFYYFEDEDADSSWPKGTVKITFTPKVKNVPLFTGSLWIRDEDNAILGVDVALSQAANTRTGLINLYDFTYKQDYKPIGEYWLPVNTEISGKLRIVGQKGEFMYKDTWTWKDYEINSTGLSGLRLRLSGQRIRRDADSKDESFWRAEGAELPQAVAEPLQAADEYKEKNFLIRAGMASFRTWLRLPDQFENSWLARVSDYYRFNRVEGHVLGLGVSSPLAYSRSLQAHAGYAFAQKEFKYFVHGYQRLPGTAFFAEANVFNETSAQFIDQEFRRSPQFLYDYQYDLGALVFGQDPRNLYDRQGFRAGIRLGLGNNSFIRAMYNVEDHERETINTRFSIFGPADGRIDPVNLPDSVAPFREGRFSGFYLQLHHDSRQYQQAGFLREFNVRRFGWLTDHTLEVSDPSSDLKYIRYRGILTLNFPVFSYHFLQTTLYVGTIDDVGGAGRRTAPGQKYFTFNGPIQDDYVRERPFLALSFREPVGTRVSALKFRYRFGSSFARRMPFKFIRESGVRLTIQASAGIVDRTESLAPLLPGYEDQKQVEVGFGLFRILSIFSFQYSRRIVGDFGQGFGLTVFF